MDFVKQIETLFRSGTAAGLTDAQSLERCIERRDDAEAAFAALLDRHALAEEVVRAIGTAKMAVAAALILVTTALASARPPGWFVAARQMRLSSRPRLRCPA